MSTPLLVVVTGMPSSGKTTVAEAVARLLRLPLIAKDEIKESLFETLGWGERAWSMKLGGASYEVLMVFLEAQLRAKARAGVGRLGLSRGEGSHDRGVVLAACRGTALSCGSSQSHQANVDQLRELPQGVEAPALGDDRPHRPLTVHRQEGLECAAVERHGVRERTLLST